jgi:chromatin remodeling complex protein RSC6
MAPKKPSAAAATTPVAPPAPTKSVSKEPEIVPVTDVANTVVSSETVDRYDIVLDKLQSIVNDSKEMISVVKALKKENAKAVKASTRRQRGRVVAADGTTKRPASGITKPTKLSDDLCDFLGIDRGSSLARTEVTKIINNYIRANKLQDESDKRTIHPDNKLKGILLPIPEGKKLSFFNMQSFIKHQFIKAVPVV